MRIRFTAAAEMRNHLGDVEYSASPGDVLELREDHAQRWLKRNMAVVVRDGEELEEEKLADDDTDSDDDNPDGDDDQGDGQQDGGDAGAKAGKKPGRKPK